MFSFFLAITFIFLAIPSLAYAYIDPGTGSFLLQVLLAAFLAVGAFSQNLLAPD